MRSERFQVEVQVEDDVPDDPDAQLDRADEVLGWLCSNPDGLPEWIESVSAVEPRR